MGRMCFLGRLSGAGGSRSSFLFVFFFFFFWKQFCLLLVERRWVQRLDYLKYLDGWQGVCLTWERGSFLRLASWLGSRPVRLTLSCDGFENFGRECGLAESTCTIRGGASFHGVDPDEYLGT